VAVIGFRKPVAALDAKLAGVEAGSVIEDIRA
jgi:hypothetical protein